tara:strand:+ start:95 stop:373 length:279 start_codon:yes stop_codon:yes gene_type:complete
MTKGNNYKFLFSIYDEVTKLFEAPFVDLNKGSAMRRIQDLMQSNPQSPYAKFPHDYKLMLVGTWNEETGYMYSNDKTTDLVVALEDITTKKE